MSFQLEEGSFLYEPLYWLYIATLLVYYVFTVPRWKHLITSMRAVYCEGTMAEVEGTNKAGYIEIGKEPHVTIAICAYNEGAVVPRTIDHACSVDWPKDKLTVHICDDSTDSTSIRFIEKSVAYWKEQGFDIERLTRPDRVGYKAGNLRYNFSRIKGDFVAYFDADHRAEKDFLRNTMPHFFDKDGAHKERTALVQTPWAFHNTHQNILTECDAFCLDTWYIYEYGRSINNKMFGFWGTGGVWRKQAVADAGGFTWESVTEDILLSYRAYMKKQYEMTYLPQYPQLLEVPPDILAHIQQKHRWTKGYLQVFRIYCWDIITSQKVPFKVKYEFFVHVLGPLQFVFNAVSFILVLHLNLATLLNSWPYKLFVLTAALEGFLTSVVALLTKVSASNGHYKSIWSRIARLRFFVPFVILQLGMTPFETKAVIDGLFSDDATFLTTPKQGSPTKATRKWTDDIVAYAALAFAAHQMLFEYLNKPFDCIESPALRRYTVFNQRQLCLGLICVSSSFLWAKYKKQWVFSLSSTKRMDRLSETLLGLTLTMVVATTVVLQA